MTDFKVGDWARHPVYGVGRFCEDTEGFKFITFPTHLKQGGVKDMQVLKKVYPKFDKFEDLFGEDEND